MKQNFPKSERLKSLKTIQKVISEGKVVRFGTIKVSWLIILTGQKNVSSATSPEIKAGFSVPKKRVKRAVERNQIRRKMKEIFRLNKDPFYSIIPRGQQLALFIIYQNDKILPYKQIETDLLSALKRVHANIKKQQNENQN
ncbi:MAG: ribonuclease P protein component [Bacteroidota bacterium]